MSKVLRIILVAAIIIISGSSNLFAISKVAARYNVMEFTVSSAQAHGSYEQIGIGVQGFEFITDLGQTFEIDADDLYENSTSFGLSYGRLINDNIVFNVGFSYINVKHAEIFQKQFEGFTYTYTYPDLFKLRMYNLDFNYNYYLSSPVKTALAPYAGVGVQTGLLSVSLDGFSSESDFIIATAFNFGADLTVWKSSDKMSSLAVSSINSYQFYASESRPKYLTIGVGLRYFMRP